MPIEMTPIQLLISSTSCGMAVAAMIFILLSKYAPHEVINHYEIRDPKAGPAREKNA